MSVAPSPPRPGSAPAGESPFWRKVGTIVSTTALVCSVLLAVLLVVPSLLGFQRYVIVSGSMVPTLPVGSVVYDEVVPVCNLVVGDIITFVPPPEYGVDDPVTHRIVEIGQADNDSDKAGQRTFRTQGDANANVDAWTMVLDAPDQGARSPPRPVRQVRLQHPEQQVGPVALHRLAFTRHRRLRGHLFVAALRCRGRGGAPTGLEAGPEGHS